MMWTTSGIDLRVAVAVFVVGSSGISTNAMAQQLYKYLGDDGVWVFADREPSGEQAFEAIPLDRSGAPATVRIVQRSEQSGAMRLVAENTFHSSVQIAFQFTTTENLAREIPTRGNLILSPLSETEFLTLSPADGTRPMRVEYRYQYIHGHPRARHEPESPYRLPYALANSHLVSQAFPQQATHTDPSSQYAIDFEMPIGTGVYAARAGTVIEVTSDYFEAGLDPATDAQRANIVRILHTDGTLALYGHLNWNSIRVDAGDKVARGQYIADSGNTGYSTGPHLHFVVQRNVGGALASVPVEFAGLADQAITVATGDRPVAR